MTEEEANEWVERIRAMASDDEGAHATEDEFREAVLKAIANGADNAKQIAEIALKTNEIDFERWCA